MTQISGDRITGSPITGSGTAGSSTNNVTPTLAIAAMSFIIGVNDPSFTRTANLAIAKMLFGVSAGKKETGAVTLPIAHMNFAILAGRRETVSISIPIARPGIAVNTIDLSTLDKIRQFSTFG